jgi:thioredoxin-related protein
MRLSLLAPILLLVACTSASADEPSSRPTKPIKVVWHTDPAKAFKVAKKTKRPVFINFTGSDWCHWCHKLDGEVFSKLSFAAYATKKLVLLEIDFPRKTKLPAAIEKRNMEFARKYHVEGFPTVLLTDHTGKEFARTGYKKGGLKVYTKHVDQLLVGFDSKTGKVKASPKSKWLLKYDAAMAQAKKTGRPVLVDFTGSDWCSWCIRLKKEVFDTKAFIEWAKDHVILLELDYPARAKQPKDIVEQNEKLQKKYNVEGFPTVLFLDSKGKVIAQTGYLAGGPSVWIKKAESLLGTKHPHKH